MRWWMRHGERRGSEPRLTEPSGPASRGRRRSFALGAASILFLAMAAPLVAPAGADTPAITDTDPAVFASSFTAQALVPYTSATLQVDDSYAWVHGFFSKGQPESTINAAEYSEIFDPGFLGGAVLFSSSSDPTPLSDPNNFPGYAWASYPVPANQTDIEKCMSPTAQVAAPCNAQSPDQAIAKIDPSKPNGSAYVTASGPTGGDVGGTFTSNSTQSIDDHHAVTVHSEGAGHNVSFAGGQLVVSGFRAVADVSATATGTVTASASCVASSFTIMGQTVQAGPGGTIDTSQIQPLLDQLNTATGKTYTINAPAPPSITKTANSADASCQGPAITVNNPLPGPLASLNVAQTFVLGAVDAQVGASPNPNSPLASVSDSGAIVSGDTSPSGGASPALPAAPGPDATAAVPAPTATPDLTSAPASVAPAPTPQPAPSTPAPAPSQAAAPSLATRPISHQAKDWWPFVLTIITGLTIVGTGAGLFGGIGRLAAVWRERVAPIG